ncbi:hypothetical protein K466DRAFT_406871 [Polyporus arcularius HHB13444]|uniref:Uncharacterized protein n=1 Tax=Polyporus arcularius HHB13444 TaxID=1314778 RepID=A0A5C3PJT2_9APHY|nr:hypothetical protein K466DRAFT_406871 [Polyporus arcularius HHB13444]
MREEDKPLQSKCRHRNRWWSFLYGKPPGPDAAIIILGGTLRPPGPMLYVAPFRARVAPSAMLRGCLKPCNLRLQQNVLGRHDRSPRGDRTALAFWDVNLLGTPFVASRLPLLLIILAGDPQTKPQEASSDAPGYSPHSYAARSRCTYVEIRRESMSSTIPPRRPPHA